MRSLKDARPRRHQTANLLNSGAFLAFMGVTAAVIRVFCFPSPAGHKRNLIFDIVFPGLTFVFYLWLWLKLPPSAKIVGGVCCVAGIVRIGPKARGFRDRPNRLDLSGS